MTTITTKRLIISCLMAVSLLAAVRTPAQAGQTGDQSQGLGLRERIGELYLIRLTRALDLTEEQTAKVYPLLTRTEKQKAEIQSKMGQDVRALRDELARSAPQEKELDALVEKIREERLLIRKMDEEAETGLDRVLTPVQRARYLVFNIEFLRNVGENLGRIRAGRPPLKRTP